MPAPLKLFASIILFFVVVFLLVDDTFLNRKHYGNGMISESKAVWEWYDYPTSSSLPKNETKLLFDHCNLEELDPWHPTVLQYVDPLSNPMKNCKPITPKISVLQNGRLFVYFQVGENECKTRCLLPDSDYSLIFGEWIVFQNGTQPKCDIFEIECFRNINGIVSKSPFYKFLHSQAYRPNPPKETEKTETISEKPDVQKEESIPPKPDVHFLIFDSVSQSQFVRSMPKTRHILREHYESIHFQHLNKIGLNSLPNGFGFLFGKQIDLIAKSGLSRGYETDYLNDSYCTEYLDNDQFIGFRFQDDGYQTLMSEDWVAGAFNWPDCKGFKSKPVDHYMRPFQLRLESAKWISRDMSRIIHWGSCRESHQDVMDYLLNFIDAYPDKPKFSISWMSSLAHDDYNGLYHADDYFYKFFLDNKEKLSNSFIFFMSDHGYRRGNMRDNTHDGEAEDNNPFFSLIIPASLRKNDSIVNNINQNAKFLVTHYDIYATLTEITNPSNPRIPNPIIKGSSLLHPLPQPRSCDRLQIPFDFCLCSAKRNTLPPTNEIAMPGAKLMVAGMNEIIRNLRELDVCVPLTWKSGSPILVEEFEEKSDVKIFKVTIFTLPGTGKFWGILAQNISNGTLTILSERFGRLNSHGHESACAYRSRYAHYCYCKNLRGGK